MNLNNIASLLEDGFPNIQDQKKKKKIQPNTIKLFPIKSTIHRLAANAISTDFSPCF